jgi:hypothetical protein
MYCGSEDHSSMACPVKSGEVDDEDNSNPEFDSDPDDGGD